jgi:hypothetical protein
MLGDFSSHHAPQRIPHIPVSHPLPKGFGSLGEPDFISTTVSKAESDFDAFSTNGASNTPMIIGDYGETAGACGRSERKSYTVVLRYHCFLVTVPLPRKIR